MGKSKIIGIAGGSGSGKTTFAHCLQRLAGDWRCSILHQDSYYHDQRQTFDVDGGKINFDHPNAIDFELLCDHLAELKARRPVQIPVYDFQTHSRLNRTECVEPQPLIVLEGILILSQPVIRAMLDVSVFIQAPEPVRFSRRRSRDSRERGRDLAGVEQQLMTQVKPMHDLFVEPSRDHADLVYSGEETIEGNVRDLLSQLEL